MKYLKMLGLAAVAAMALMAFVGAGSASAAALCSTNTNPCTGTNYGVGTKIHAQSVGHVVLSAAFAKAECNSTVEGEVTGTGGAAVVGKITKLSFTNCTSPCTAATALETGPEGEKTGSLQVTPTGGGNGTVKGFNSKVTVTCSGVSCIFGTAATGTALGTFTGGNPAKLDVSASVVYFTGDAGSFVCTAGAGTGGWTGTYEVTTPKPVFSV